MYVDGIKLAGKKQNIDPMWKVLLKEVDFGEPTFFLNHVYLVCTQRECPTSKKKWTITEVCLNPKSLLELQKSYLILRNLAQTFPHGPMIWKVMQRNVWKDIANWRTKQLNNYTKSRHHALTTTNSRKKKWDQLENCQKYAHKLFWNACIWLALVDLIFYGPWTNLLELSLSARACDKRSARLISYIHHTCEFKQYRHVGNTAQQCRLGLFQDSDFAGDLEDSKSTSGGVLCIFGSQTFVPISWRCKKQTSVSHSSTEAEIISLDAGLRMDGIPALDLWGLVIEVFHFSPNQSNNTKDQVRGNSSRNTTSNKHTQNQTKVPTQHDNLDLSNVHHVSSNAKSSRLGAMLYIFEDNEAVVKMIIEGRSKSYDETRVQNPQSCAGLVVWHD